MLEVEGDGLIVGRDPPSDGLRIEDPRLSRSHARIVLAPDGSMRIQDLNSTNGTQVNRAQVSGALQVWSDAVIRIGDTVLHAGVSMPASALPGNEDDPALLATAQRVVGAGEPVSLLGTDLDAQRRLARVLHRRLGRTGPFVEVTGVLLSPDDLIGQPGGSVLLTRCESMNSTGLEAWASACIQSDTLLIVSARNDGASASIVSSDARRLLVRPYGERRAYLWGETVRILEQTMDSVPPFRPSACVAWLSLPLEGGLTNWHARIHRLVDVIQAESPETIRVHHFHVESEPVDAAGRRDMRRPSPEQLEVLMSQFGSAQAIATHLGCNRRQIYRWMDAYGIEKTAATWRKGRIKK